MKRPQPDLRPSWRDPNLPCICNYTMNDGRKLTEVSPEWEQEWRKICMEINQAPDWHNDPTYDLKKQRKKL
jgi:hypothetical protein